MMFSDDSSHVFALPPGVDFVTELVSGLTSRMENRSPGSLARVEILVNTRRMARQIRQVFDEGPPRLLPNIQLITDLGLSGATIPPAVAPLRRQLELAQLITKLQRANPDLAPESALFDLSESLAALLDEMQGEGVAPDILHNLDVTDQSGHWQRSLQFLDIVQSYLKLSSSSPDPEARQRLVVEQLIQNWKISPPDHPILIAGSTGSRGTTSLLMQAVINLPQGAIVLPGFDFDLPDSVWGTMSKAKGGEDHPQFRFQALFENWGISAKKVQRWTGTPPPSEARNRLISLSLRPAPVTDVWRREGDQLTDILIATKHITLVEAPSPRAEAETIALRLRVAIDDGLTAALITPDRMLTRQVSAALDRWNITPDDSAGQPLALSPPGRFLRHVAELFDRPTSAEALLTLLKHPLTFSGHPDRGAHLRHTRELELELRRYGPAFPNAASLMKFAEKGDTPNPDRVAWAIWLGNCLADLQNAPILDLTRHLKRHISLAEQLAAGIDGQSGELWDKAAGREALRQINTLRLHSDAGGSMSGADYLRLLTKILSSAEVRNPEVGHPQILFWGTLEARVQGADLMILAGLNEGIWPATPTPDPWLNRKMRAEAGLLMPERRIGLSAHDYQQAIAAKTVWITRSLRSEDAETVPARWLNRLTNLLDGLPENDGEKSLSEMRVRGNNWLSMANQISAPKTDVDKALRPSPRPPINARPKALSVTRISTLIRDPYAIYAEYVLRLKSLDPVAKSADAPLRGQMLHTILEQFIKQEIDPNRIDAKEKLLQIALTELETSCPWPAVRRMWLARVGRFADWFLETEIIRQTIAHPDASRLEIWGDVALEGLDFHIKGKADRIDLTPDGKAMIYDYKTGAVPTPKQQTTFDKQLLVEAAMVENDAFKALGSPRVHGATFIGLGPKPGEVKAPLKDESPEQVWAFLHDLIRAWNEPDRGYTARWAVANRDANGPYDHLSRYGEWEISDDPTPEDLS